MGELEQLRDAVAERVTRKLGLLFAAGQPAREQIEEVMESELARVDFVTGPGPFGAGQMPLRRAIAAVAGMDC